MEQQEAAQRAAVVREAMEWVGTPYRHLGRVKGAAGGVDCAMLIAEVFERAGVLPRMEAAYYPPDWHLHRDVERFLAYVMERAREISDPLPGDVVLFRFGRAFSHSAIVVNPGWPSIVHSDRVARRVWRGEGNGGELNNRPRRFFSVWGAPA